MKKYSGRIVTAFLALVLLLSACGSRSSSSYYEVNGWDAKQAAYDSYDMEMAAEAPAGMMAAGMAVAETAAAAAMDNGGQLSEDDLSAAAAEETPSARKLIRNVNLSLQTTEYDAVVDNIRRRVTECGGYIEQSDARDSGYNDRTNRSMNMTVRIPADRLDGFLETAVTGARVISRSENTQDITLRYTDLEARVKTLEVERDRLMELLAEADNIDSIIALESRLSEIRYELESIQSSLRVYDNQVDYSTVWINLAEVQVIQEARQASFAERVSAKFRQNLLDLMDTVTELLIDIISNLPAIILLIVVVWIILRIIRIVFGKDSREARREKKQRKKELKQQKKELKQEEKARIMAGSKEAPKDDPPGQA